MSSKIKSVPEFQSLSLETLTVPEIASPKLPPPPGKRKAKVKHCSPEEKLLAGFVGLLQSVRVLDCSKSVLRFPGGRTARNALGMWFHSNKRTARDTLGQWFHPNRKRALNTLGEWFHPTGKKARDTLGQWFHPNGRIAKDTLGRWFHPNRQAAYDTLGRLFHADGRSAGHASSMTDQEVVEFIGGSCDDDYRVHCLILKKDEIGKP